jgi:hypothetical protein
MTEQNRYSTGDACRHCEGLMRREFWRLTHNASAQYAYHPISDPESLCHGDHLI